MNPTGNDAIPCRLHGWKMFHKPLAITGHTDDDKLFRLAFTCRTVLNEITLIKIRNLELKLDLGQIVLGHLGFNFARQGALDFDQQTVFRDAVWRRSEPWVLAMAHESDFMRFTSGLLVV